MEAKAKARYVRVTPQKARRVVDLIRGKQADEAMAVLKFAPQAAAEPVQQGPRERDRQRSGTRPTRRPSVRRARPLHQRGLRRRGPDA